MIVALAVVASGAVSSGMVARFVLVVAGATGVYLARGSRSALVLIIMVLAAIGVLRGEQARSELQPTSLGVYTGWARVVDDPQPYPSATRVIVEIDGERFEIWARGRAAGLRVGQWRGGDYHLLSGELVGLDVERQSRVGWQHVVGEMRVDWYGDTRAGSAIDRASNRVRELIERGGSVLPGDDGALFRGLVIGDDREQPPEMIDRFRASGLSHLTAVSGQNVSFVLIAAAPILRALRPLPRWLVTLGLIAWFVALTRFEPSIVRAGAMAGLSATAFMLGRDRGPLRMLALAVIGLQLVDPMLSESVGWWLSVGATAGVIVVGPWLTEQFRRLGILAAPIGVTLGAQVGVVIPAVLVFGRLPLVSIPANLLAVPVAGFVMLYGLPAGLAAGLCPPIAPVVMFPCRVGVRWVDTVAILGDRVEPSPPVAWTGWGVITAVVMVALAVNAARNLGNDECDPSLRQ